ncbi:hypothetical protein [uncultured Ferrimonas sp.]|uniref:hypothetical protein n=1 Tax=uncultured Ferrimonas sp. TaxID=432640 RepID=UPI002618361C|nr:hypothetical protein [uncultured Ferrimonas sp.]
MNNAKIAAAIGRFYECWDRGNRERNEQVVAPERVDHDRSPLAAGNDVDAIGAWLQFLDGLAMNHEIEQLHMLVEDQALVRWTASAQYIGELFGMPARVLSVPQTCCEKQP